MGIFNKKNKKADNSEPVKKKDTKDGKKPQTSMKNLYGDEPKNTAKQKVLGTKSGQTGNAYRVLEKPLITEKAANLGADNKYAFVVSLNSNKIEIKKAIKEVYGIEPENVNIVRFKGKKVRQGKYSGKRKDWKKAIISLPKGKTITIHEGV